MGIEVTEGRSQRGRNPKPLQSWRLVVAFFVWSLLSNSLRS